MSDNHPHEIVRIAFMRDIPSAPVILHDVNCDVYIAGVVDIAGVSEPGDGVEMLKTFDMILGPLLALPGFPAQQVSIEIPESFKVAFAEDGDVELPDEDDDWDFSL
jgi:hypothetical protein